MIRVNGYETILSPKESESIPEELVNIQYKKYLTQDYKPALVDDFKQKAFLRGRNPRKVFSGNCFHPESVIVR